MCMGEGDNLIKQADRRRKQEWQDDRLMPTSAGMAHTHIHTHTHTHTHPSSLGVVE